MQVKSQAQRQQARRERMRRDGFVLRQLWVHPDDWQAVRKYVESKRKARTTVTVEASRNEP